MTNEEIRALYDQQMRYNSNSSGYRREETEHVVRYISENESKGFILYSNVNEENAQGVIKGELAYFSKLNQAFEWKVYDYDQPDTLKQFLEAEGFQSDEPEAVMVLELDPQHPLIQSQTQTPFYVSELTDREGIQDLIKLEESIWEMSFKDLGKKLSQDKEKDPESLFIYGVYDNHQLVSGAWMYLEKGSSFASLWGGSTLPAFRNKGCYSALLQVRAFKALELGHPLLQVDASPMSRPILQKHGFHCMAIAVGCQSPEGVEG